MLHRPAHAVQPVPAALPARRPAAVVYQLGVLEELAHLPQHPDPHARLHDRVCELGPRGLSLCRQVAVEGRDGDRICGLDSAVL